MMKQAVIAASLAAIVSSCASIPSNLPTFRESSQLVVNHNTTYRTVVHNTCKEEGIQQIRKLVETEPLEESWLYYPQLCTWEEVGINSLPKDGGIFVWSDLDQLVRAFENHKDLVMVHFHPLSIYQQSLSGETQNGFSVPSTKDVDEEVWPSFVNLNIPSLVDYVDNLFHVTYEFDKGTYPHFEGSLKSVIVTLYGYYEISLDGQGRRENYQEKTQALSDHFSLTPFFGRTFYNHFHPQGVKNLAKRNNYDVQQIFAEAARRLDSFQGVKTTYTPFTRD